MPREKNKIDVVNVTKEAHREFAKMVKFIEENQQSPASSKRFIDNFSKRLEVIKQQPNSCPPSSMRPGTRLAFFDKFGAFLYRVFEKSIRIVTFFDTRSKQ